MTTLWPLIQAKGQVAAGELVAILGSEISTDKKKAIVGNEGQLGWLARQKPTEMLKLIIEKKDIE